MKLLVMDPVTLVLTDISPEEMKFLETDLTYHDKRVDFELNKFKHATWYATKYGQEAYDEKLKQLKAERYKSLLFQNNGVYWTYTGLASRLMSKYPDAEIGRRISKLPKAEALPWLGTPLTPYPYQEKILDAMLANQHCGVEVATGLGKTNCLSHLVRQKGLQTAVIAPGTSIANQIYDRLVNDLGKRYIGFYGDGKKNYDKLITVGTAQSFTRIEPNSAAWNKLSQCQLMVFDESHLCPATTLSKICFGLFKDATFRYFLSGTQFRNDGLDLLLEGITGPIVYRMDVQEGIKKGYLSKLDFTMVNVRSNDSFESRDVNDMTRAHLYYNENVNRAAADLANRFVTKLGSQVLILVEELEQFTSLLPYFSQEAAFAHGSTGAEAMKVLPQKFQKSDPDALVARFNNGKLPILVGTSCIATGTDIKANKATIYLRGGKSEIEVMQGAIGRSTRVHPLVDKTSCQIIDFRVVNVPTLRRHADERKKIYEQVAPVRELAYGD